jgi:hypothetical protein
MRGAFCFSAGAGRSDCAIKRGVLYVCGNPDAGGGIFVQSYTKAHLPSAALRCSINLAYQAADVSHPDRVEPARRIARNFAEYSFLIRLYAAKAPITAVQQLLYPGTTTLYEAGKGT